MKVMHIISGLGDGGAESALYRLCISDSKCQHQVVSLTDATKYGSLLEDAGIPVLCLGMSKGIFSVLKIVALWNAIRSQKPDVVQTWMYHSDFLGGVVARFAGVRRVFWGVHHSVLQLENAKRATVLIAWINSLLSYFIPLKIVCCAESAKLIHEKMGYCSRKLFVIFNGYDFGYFFPTPEGRSGIRRGLNFDESTPVLGMVGRFCPEKNHENLLAALGQLKRDGVFFRCLLVGNAMTPENHLLKNWIRQYDVIDEVVLLGQRTDIPSIMSSLDIFVLSSLSEAFPNVLSEAMACGTPCVSTDVGDAKFIVGDTGWIVPPKDSKCLLYAIKHALQESKEKEKWIVRQNLARKRVVQNFDMLTMKNSYLDVWSS